LLTLLGVVVPLRVARVLSVLVEVISVDAAGEVHHSHALVISAPACDHALVISAPVCDWHLPALVVLAALAVRVALVASFALPAPAVLGPVVVVVPV
jgi:hypothetical protein